MTRLVDVADSHKRLLEREAKKEKLPDRLVAIGESAFESGEVCALAVLLEHVNAGLDLHVAIVLLMAELEVLKARVDREEDARIIVKAMNREEDLDELRFEARELAEALRGVIREADRDTDAFVRARAILVRLDAE